MKRYGLLTVGEAAKQLRRNRELVRRWLREGRLKGLRFGQSWVIDQREIARFEHKQPERRQREG